MKLKLSSSDFETGEITFLVPMDIFKRLEFYPCELDVDIEPLKRKITSNNSENTPCNHLWGPITCHNDVEYVCRRCGVTKQE